LLKKKKKRRGGERKEDRGPIQVAKRSLLDSLSIIRKKGNKVYHTKEREGECQKDLTRPLKKWDLFKGKGVKKEKSWIPM